MTYARYGLYLLITTVLAILLAVAAHAYWKMPAALPLTAGMIFLLVLLSVAIFFLGKRTATSSNKFLFGNVFMASTMIKMFACGGLIAAYALLAEPATKTFVVPFFTSYGLFTLLEIIALVTLAGEQAPAATPPESEPV